MWSETKETWKWNKAKLHFQHQIELNRKKEGCELLVLINMIHSCSPAQGLEDQHSFWFEVFILVLNNPLFDRLG